MWGRATEQLSIFTPRLSDSSKSHDLENYSTEKRENGIPLIYSLLLRINEIEPKYYADGEDAYAMKRDLVVWSKQQVGYITLCIIIIIG